MKFLLQRTGSLLLVLVALATGQGAYAGTIVYFNEHGPGEGPLTVSVDNAPDGFSVTTAGNERSTVTLNNFLTNSHKAFNQAFILTEPNNGNVKSDLVQFVSSKNSTTLKIFFRSDNGTVLTVPSGATVYGSATEVSPFNVIPPSAVVAAAIAGGNTLQVRVSSVPEPSSLALGGLGVLISGGAWSRRRRLA